MLQGGQSPQAYSRAIAQALFLERLGIDIAACEIRLLYSAPAAFELRSVSQRRKALTVTALPKVSRDGRLQAAMQHSEAAAFTLSNQDVVDYVRRELRLQQCSNRLSRLPVKTASDILQNMQMVEAMRSSRDETLMATNLCCCVKFPPGCFGGNPRCWIIGSH